MTRGVETTGTAKIRETTRLTLIRTGLGIIREKGFNNSGLQEILQASGVPKGSFYHFFASKEDFGLAIIEYDAGEHQREMERFLGDTSCGAVERLRRYFEAKCRYFESRRHREGCLLGNLGQELADQNETFRVRIERFFADWCAALAGCLKEAQKAREIPAHLSPDSLAAFLVNSWEGAITQMKITKRTEPLQLFMDFVFGVLLKPSS
jgi:TetR/AcrR family transcriptional repressor of nem operon